MVFISERFNPIPSNIILILLINLKFQPIFFKCANRQLKHLFTLTMTISLTKEALHKSRIKYLTNNRINSVNRNTYCLYSRPTLQYEGFVVAFFRLIFCSAIYALNTIPLIGCTSRWHQLNYFDVFPSHARLFFR